MNPPEPEPPQIPEAEPISLREFAKQMGWPDPATQTYKPGVFLFNTTRPLRGLPPSESANGAAYTSLGQSPQESVAPDDFEG